MSKEYIPYGPEWQKEISKFPKQKIIEMLGMALSGHGELTDGQLDKYTSTFIKEEPVRFTMFMLLQMGRQAIKSNSNLTLSQQFDYENKRHEVIAEITTKEIKI